MKSDRKSIVYFVSPVSFPMGGAGTARKYALARGLVKLGYDVHIISTINDGSGENAVREYNGIMYHCSAPSSSWGGNIWNKLVHLVVGQIQALRYIKSHSISYSDVLITTNQYKVLFLLPVMIVAKIMGAFLFTELNENPMITRHNENYLGRLFRYINIWISLRMYDTIFVMTHTLKELLVQKYGIKQRIPILHNAVDIERFSAVPKTVKKMTIGYAGSLSFRKDSLDILLQAVKRLRNDYPSLRLRIAYFSTDPYLTTFQEYVKKICMDDAIDMLPDVANNAIPEFLSTSELLILIRVPNEQTNFGFPTKLVEYLASGRPVVVSSVSDIPRFLTHLKDAYILTKSDVNSVANAISYMFENRNLIQELGNNGRNICLMYFDSIIEAKKIVQAHVVYLSRHKTLPH